jgi:hypothetical protein
MASHPDDTLLIVGGYTDIDLLAHTPCVKSQKISAVAPADAQHVHARVQYAIAGEP